MSKNSKKFAATKRASTQRNSETTTAAPGPKTVSKHDQILGLLRPKQGASLEEIQKVSNWQEHSVRGFLSGTVKKRLGLPLRSFKTKIGERRYTTAGV